MLRIMVKWAIVSSLWGLRILVFAQNDWVCDYYLADFDGLTMNKVVATKGVGFSLHGVWNKVGNYSGPCISHDKFIYNYHNKLIQNKLVHFIDASPLSEHTCCVSQWHEYYKHGCNQRNSYEDWDSAVEYCLNNFHPEKMYVHRCRFDSRLKCNHVDEVSNKPLEVYDCRKGYPFCSEFCWHDQLRSMCRVEGVHFSRPYYYAVKFKYEDIPPKNPYRDSPNCFCDINPNTKVLELSQVEILPFSFEKELPRKELTPEFEMITTAKPRMRPSFKEPTTTTTVLPIQADTPLECTCFNNTEENNFIDVELVRRNEVALDFFKLPPMKRYTLQNFVGEFKIYCFNKSRVLKELPRSTDMRILEEDDEMLILNKKLTMISDFNQKKVDKLS